MIQKNWAFCFCDFETTGVRRMGSEVKHYPIEVGCVFTDYRFNVLNTVDKIIKWQELIDKAVEANNDWPDEYKTAVNYHKLDWKDYLKHAVPADNVAKEIDDICGNLYRNKAYDRIILISDNAQFEDRFMWQLFEETIIKRWPFHYCTWDTSLLLELLGIGDPPGDSMEHRALADAAQLYRFVIKAINMTPYPEAIGEK